MSVKIKNMSVKIKQKCTNTNTSRKISNKNKFFTILFKTTILSLCTTGVYSSKVQDFFSGPSLSYKALRYEDQDKVIKSAPTKPNDLPSITQLLSTAAAEIESRLESRAADAIGLANAAKTSTTHSTNNYGDGPQSCCNRDTEIGYNHYFKSEVDMQNMCFRGVCDLSGASRSLSGTPTCDKAVISGTFLTEVKKNMNDPGAAWQYFGAEAGVSTMFPASYAGPENCPNDPYDPRLRPWYVQSLTSSPLDVVVILDKSGSMMINQRMSSAMTAVKSILSMLRPYDRFAVTPFDSGSNSEVWTGASCMDSNRLAFATGKNVAMMQDYVSTLQPGGGTMYSYALNFAKTIFENSETNVTDEQYANESNQRKRVMMFLSDGDPNDSGQQIMLSLKSLVETVPDLITMVYGLDIDNQILRDVSTHEFTKYGVSNPAVMPNAGEFEKLTPDNIRLKLGRFYASDKVNPNGLSSLVQYSMPYVDSFGMGLMVTASKSVLDDNSKLQGVVGYDITLKYLLEPLEYMITETTYAWMFTRNRGYMIYHPSLVNPSASLNDINPVHYSILEPDLGLINAITSKLNNTNFTVNYTGERFVITPREGGFTSTGKTTVAQTKELFTTECRTVNPNHSDFELVMCVTKAGDLQSTLDTNQVFATVEPKTSTYHVAKKDQAGVCAHGFRRAYKSSGGVKFSPRQFSIPTRYITENETEVELGRMNDLINGVVDSHANLQNDVVGKTRATNYIMSGLDSNWKTQDTELLKLFGSSSSMVIDTNNADSEVIPVWRYFGSIEGTFRVWPSTQLAQAYDPAQRGWFTQALRGVKGTTFISAPYIDAFGMGYLITVSRTMNYDNNGEISGIIGTDYFVSQFGESALSSTDYKNSIIVDSIGQLIYHSDFNPTNYGGFFPYVNVKFEETDKSISGSEPLTVSEVVYEQSRLSDILKNAQVPIFKCHDITGLRTKATFDLARYFEEKGNVESLDINDLKITRLVGTNAFIVSPKKSGFKFSVLHEDIDFYGNGLKEAKVTDDGWPIIKRASWASSNALTYDQCKNEFSGGDEIPACQGSSPSLDDSYLGKFDKYTGFKNQDIQGLEDCFVYMYSWKDYFLYKEDAGNFGTFSLNKTLIVVLLVIGAYGLMLLMNVVNDEENEEVTNDNRHTGRLMQGFNDQPKMQAPQYQSVAVSPQPIYQPVQPVQQTPLQPVFNITVQNNNDNKNN